jgi:hypothetical protein
MSRATSANRSREAVALVGPGRPPTAAAARIPLDRIERFSLNAYLARNAAPSRVVLCPAGRGLDADLSFLRAARARLLWKAPPREIGDAIAGLVTAPEPARGGRTRARSSQPHHALLLEGLITRRNAFAALASDVRLWVVQDVRHVRLTGAELALLARQGVRWAALSPVRLAGLAASPALRRARSRWPAWARRLRVFPLGALISSEAPRRRPSTR